MTQPQRTSLRSVVLANIRDRVVESISILNNERRSLSVWRDDPAVNEARQLLDELAATYYKTFDRIEMINRGRVD